MMAHDPKIFKKAGVSIEGCCLQWHFYAWLQLYLYYVMYYVNQKMSLYKATDKMHIAT